MTKTDILNDKISHKVDILLSTSNVAATMDIVNSGYILNKHQIKKYDDIINRLIMNNNTDTIIPVLSKNGHISHPSLLKFIDSVFGIGYDRPGYSYDKNYINRENKVIINFLNGIAEFSNHLGPAIIVNFNNPQEVEAVDSKRTTYIKDLNLFINLKPYVLNKEFQEFLYNNLLKFSKQFFTPHYQLSFKIAQEFLFISNETIKDNRLDNFLTIIKNLKKYNQVYYKKYTKNKEISHYWDSNFYSSFNGFINHLESKITTIFNNIVEEAIEESKLLSLGNNLTPKSIENITHVEKSFPERISNQIDILKATYSKISSNHYIAENISNIIDDRLPKILNQYVNMLPEYRLSLTNHQGKNSEDLLFDSLIEMNDILEKELKYLQQENLKELSVSSKVLKMKNQ